MDAQAAEVTGGRQNRLGRAWGPLLKTSQGGQGETRFGREGRKYKEAEAMKTASPGVSLMGLRRVRTAKEMGVGVGGVAFILITQ